MRPKSKNKLIKTQTSLTKEQRQRLKELAAEYGVTLSNYIRIVLDKHITEKS